MPMFEDKWNDYAKKFVPAPIGSNQYTQLRIAFYGGACVIMGAVEASGQENVSEDAAVWLLASLKEELNQFTANLVADGLKRREEARRKSEGN